MGRSPSFYPVLTGMGLSVRQFCVLLCGFSVDRCSGFIPLSSFRKAAPHPAVVLNAFFEAAHDRIPFPLPSRRPFSVSVLSFLLSRTPPFRRPELPGFPLNLPHALVQTVPKLPLSVSSLFLSSPLTTLLGDRCSPLAAFQHSRSGGTRSHLDISLRDEKSVCPPFFWSQATFFRLIIIMVSRYPTPNVLATTLLFQCFGSRHCCFSPLFSWFLLRTAPRRSKFGQGGGPPSSFGDAALWPWLPPLPPLP